MLKRGMMLAAAVLATGVAWAQQAAPAGETDSQKAGRERVMEMARFLADADKYSVTMRVGYDSVQPNGQKIEFGEIREVSLQRPNRARIKETSSDGEGNDLVFDGMMITVLDKNARTYAQAPQPGDLEHAVLYYLRDLQMRLPLAAMLVRTYPLEIETRALSYDLVEHTSIMGQPAQHVTVRTEDVDFQAWIADGKQPLPLRMVMTYKKAAGQPQFWANFSKWNFAPTFSPSTFTFKAPAKARPIGFAVQVQPNLPPQAQDLKQGAKK